MKVVTFAQRKGGAGKTTTCRMLGEYLAHFKKKNVLLMDFDNQCNLSSRYLDMELSSSGGRRPPLHPEYEEGEEGWNGRPSTADIYYKGVVCPYPTVERSGEEGLDIVPASTSWLTRVAEQDGTVLRTQVIHRLRRWVEANKDIYDYEYLLVDTPPTSNCLTLSAIHASDYLVIPVEFEEQHVEGLGDLISLWSEENRGRARDRKLKILGIQPNRVRMRTVLHQGYLHQFQNNPLLGPHLTGVLIPELSAFAERNVPDARPRNIFQLSPSNRARQVAEEFCSVLCDRLERVENSSNSGS